MKPVVSSIVAIAIAFAPLAALASPEKSASEKPVAAKAVKHKKEAAKKEKADKADKTEKSEITRVKHTKKPALNLRSAEGGRHPEGALRPVVHHAHGVDVGGAGHKEPKIEKGVQVVPASMTTKTIYGKSSHAKPGTMAKLVKASATTKPMKSASEKGARKSPEKKGDASPDDGQPERDGELADLVARIRGKHPHEAEAKASSKHEPKTCLKDPIEVIRGPETETFPLTKCDGTIAPFAIEHLSILVRPGSAARPTAPLAELAKKKGDELAPGVRRVDDRLAMRVQMLANHFAKTGTPVKLSVISGYRPMSVGSMHATGRAIDFRIEGARNEDVVAFCKTLTDTGCGYYPNSSFVHIDVRDPGAGHVSWIDASGPGEAPRYVQTWPPRPSAASRIADLESASAKEPVSSSLDREAAPETVDEHPAEATEVK